MKREIVPVSKSLLVVYRLAIALVIVVLAVLLAGTLYALFRPAEPLFRGSSRPVPNATVSNPDYTAEAVFTGIGRLRIAAAGQPPATVILSISFPYPAQDRPFSEELAACIGEFRSIAAAYFSSLPLQSIVNLDEAAAKAEILRRYNALLRLGKIETLYFSDLMIVE